MNKEQSLLLIFLLIISSIGAGVGYLIGQATEETVENIAGVSKKLVEQHKRFSLIALVSLTVLGATSIVDLFLTSRKPPFIIAVAVVVLFISLISFGLVAWTGYLGGQKTHTKINSNPASSSPGGDSKEHD